MTANKHAEKEKAGFRAFWLLPLLLYLAYLIYLTFFSHRYGRGYLHRSINVVPFRTILEYAVASYNKNIIMTNLLGNIVAFAPLGFLMPLVFRKEIRAGRIVLSSVAVSALIELFQYVLGIGAADVDDLILNTAGGILGFLLYLLASSLFRRFHFFSRLFPE